MQKKAGEKGGPDKSTRVDPEKERWDRVFRGLKPWKLKFKGGEPVLISGIVKRAS